MPSQGTNVKYDTVFDQTVEKQFQIFSLFVKVVCYNQRISMVKWLSLLLNYFVKLL